MTIYQRKNLGFCLSAFLLTCSGISYGQNTSSQTVNESAAIYAPLRLTKLTDLCFGGIVQGPNAGDVTMSEKGERQFPNDPLGPTTYNGAASYSRSGATAASFIVTGEASNSYTISTPATSLVSDGTNTMTITLGKPIGTNVSPDGTSSKISSDGSDSWKIGATLSVGAGQPSGLYTGSFTEIITYE